MFSLEGNVWWSEKFWH